MRLALVFWRSTLAFAVGCLDCLLNSTLNWHRLDFSMKLEAIFSSKGNDVYYNKWRNVMRLHGRSFIFSSLERFFFLILFSLSDGTRKKVSEETPYFNIWLGETSTHYKEILQLFLLPGNLACLLVPDLLIQKLFKRHFHIRFFLHFFSCATCDRLLALSNISYFGNMIYLQQQVGLIIL